MSSNDNVKYWWYKEYKNDTEDHRRKCLKAVKHGYEALVVLDDLKHEAVSHEGVLRYSEERAYSNEELAIVLGEPIKILEKSLQLLLKYGFIFIEKDNTIIIKDFQKRIGYETGKAKRMREYHEKEAQTSLQKGSNEPNDRLKCSLNIKKESKDKVKEIIKSYLSTSKLIYAELNRTEQFEEIVLMMTKAAEITNRLPSKEKLEELSRSFMDWKEESDIHNMQGYLVNIFKMEGEQI